MKRALPKMVKAPAGQNSLLTNFIKIQKREIAGPSQSTCSTGTDSTQKPSVEETKKPLKKRETKTKAKGELYQLPKSYNHTHDHKNGEWKDGKVNLWMWNINGVNAVLTKGNLQHFFDTVNPDIVCFNETKIGQEKINSISLHKYFPMQYFQYWNCSKAKLGYAGTAILSKVEPIKV